MAMLLALIFSATKFEVELFCSQREVAACDAGGEALEDADRADGDEVFTTGDPCVSVFC